MNVERVIHISNSLVKAISEVPMTKELTPVQQILIKGLSGAIGAGISNTVLFPFESIKTRLMLQSDESNDSEKFGVREMIAEVYRKEGLGGFFVGIKSYVIYSVGTYGIFFLIYETIK